MKIGKLIIAAAVASVFSAVFAGLTCGWVFNWVYKLAPTNIWKQMSGPPSLWFHLGSLWLNMILVTVYAMLYKGFPGKNKMTKGLVFGLCVWAVGMLPGMFATYSFMTVATGVVIYWTFVGLAGLLLKGMIIAAIYEE